MVLGAPAAVLTALACAPSPASAAGGLQRCIDQAAGHGGELPVCTKVDGRWVASWPDEGVTSGGAGGMIVLLMVLGVVAAVGLVAWRVTTAQRLAREAGLDPRTATQMALLSDDGLDATYLAASLRRPTPSHAVDASAGTTPPPIRSVAERLTELGSLRDQGVISQEEHDERRRGIIGEV
jgi:hypothetical protein